jgi:CubicO group peptidase (beta-lactamase class C family)
LIWTKFNWSKIIIFCFSGLTLSGGGLIVSNWTFLKRVVTYPDRPITAVDWYEPLETVAGNTHNLPKATTTEIPQNTLMAIARYAQKQNSAALLVMHRGEIVLEKYWQRYTLNSVSNSMSMSKTLVSLLIGIAIQEGRINSELDTVAAYLPEWSQDERRTITIQDLLYMQSGLRNSYNTDDLRSDLVQMYASPDAARVALNIPALKPSGKVFEYNNANTQILGVLLEKVTGMRYAEYLSTRLWQPLQASDASLWLDRQGGSPKLFCCFFATARDWGKVGQLLLDRAIRASSLN